MTRRWTLRLGARLVVAATLLTGCSEKHEASTALPSNSAAESTPELPPLGPDDLPMPDDARTKDAAGAEAFVRYYIELINRTSTVMDAKPLREFSDSCRDCDRIADDTESDAAAGYSYEGGELTISFIKASEPAPDASVSFTADQAALTVVDSGGNAVEGLVFDAMPDLSCGASAKWDAARSTWVLTGLTLG